MTQHTPTPWEARHGRWIVSTRGEHEGEILVAPTYWMENAPDEATANAAFIVTACNAHDELVSALRDLLLATTDEFLTEQQIAKLHNASYAKTVMRARAALARATLAAQEDAR